MIQVVEVVFSEGVQQRMQFCSDHLNCVKMADFQFHLQLEKQRNVGWVGDDSHVLCGQKFSGEKGSVRWCVIMMQQPVPLLTKFGGNSSHIFSHRKSHSSTQKWLFDLPRQILDEHDLDFALQMSCHCRSQWVWTIHEWLVLPTRTLV
jgi:hypothetical protein